MASKGQKFNSYSPELKQEILNKYFNQNQSYSSLALEYSVSKGTIKTCVFKTKNGNNPMKQIQEWLGHADFSTTTNIYSHLDYSTKLNSANTMTNVFAFS